jgi:hypothetical protein
LSQPSIDELAASMYREWAGSRSAPAYEDLPASERERWRVEAARAIRRHINQRCGR